MSRTSAKNAIVSAQQIPARLKHVVWVTLALSLPWSLGACASNTAPKDTGQRLSERGSEIGAYGTAWSDGNKNVQKGEQSVEKSTRSLADGERDLTRARADVAKAEQQISDATAAKAVAQKRVEDGKLQMTRAEADYAATRAGPSAVTPPN
jgi:septal ring factor EnvC (AmiA/AmiB activator)